MFIYFFYHLLNNNSNKPIIRYGISYMCVYEYKFLQR